MTVYCFPAVTAVNVFGVNPVAIVAPFCCSVTYIPVSEVPSTYLLKTVIPLLGGGVDEVE